MAPRRKRRDQWRMTKNGWTISLGQRGRRVKLFQNGKDGFFYREVFQPGGSRDRKSLGTRDRDEAERIGRELLSMLLVGQMPKRPSVVRLGELAEAFITECPMFLDNAPKTQADWRSRIAVIRGAIGDERDVRTLTENDVRQYEARRKAGGIRYGDGKVTGAVRQRSAQADIKLLKQMLYWACTRTVGGQRWLDQNPLQYVRVQRERDVRRPVASFDRYEATVKAMRDLQRKYDEESRAADSMKARRRAESRLASWVRAEMALWLLETTGRRRGAIMGLRWSDFDVAAKRVTWRADEDKGKKTRVVPYPDSFFATMRDFQRRLGAVGGYVFARTDDPERPAPPELLSQWIRKAEDHAGLPKLTGGTTHPYRRKWRSERNHLPLKAVAHAGGWDDFDTMIRCYDHPEDADVLMATSETRKRREAVGQAVAVD